MRLVQWNVCGGFSAKLQHLLALQPDVAIVSEVLPTSLWPDVPGVSLTGLSKRVCIDAPKELAVLAQGAWSVQPLAELISAPPWVLPVRIDGPVPFTVVAVWPVKMPGAPSYVGQLQAAISWLEEADLAGEVVVGGDLNAPIRSSQRQFELFSAHAERLGLVNAYRFSRALGPHEAPTEATYFHQRRSEQPFHIDHIFVPTRWADRLTVTVGDYSTWVASGLSDHAPVAVTIDLTDRAEKPC